MDVNRRMLLKSGIAAALLPAQLRPSLASGVRNWKSSHFADNPLVGQVFDQAGPAGVGIADVMDKAAATRFVMLGEIHPNPDHHVLQAEFLAHMIARGRKPAVVFEMVTRAQQPVLDAMMANSPADASTIAERLEWQASGWPDFILYQPLFELALQNKLTIRAGNLDKATVRRMGGRVGAGLSDAERAALGLDTPMAADAAGALLEVIKTSHCNMLPDTVLPMMRDIQRARDFVMADAMMNAANKDGAVLICGSGHARLDWGAGRIVNGDSPGKLLSVAFAEASESRNPSDYGIGGHHFTIVTPRHDVTDHCAQFIKQKNRQ